MFQSATFCYRKVHLLTKNCALCGEAMCSFSGRNLRTLFYHLHSRRGARASAILYSIAETSKANGLKPYEYFKYLLEQMLAHLDDKPADYIDDLLPWSEKIPEYCRLKTFE